MKYPSLFLLFIFSILHFIDLHGQQSPTPAPTLANSNNNGNFWARTGNNNGVNSNNLFGTFWNSPIYTITSDEGQINVFADDLSNGIYSYALVADGQIADTKKMVRAN